MTTKSVAHTAESLHRRLQRSRPERTRLSVQTGIATGDEEQTVSGSMRNRAIEVAKPLIRSPPLLSGRQNHGLLSPDPLLQEGANL